MPDWGMWDMKFTKEEKLKLIERVWYNGEIKNKVYNRFGNYWYDGDACPVCNVGLSHDNADYSAGYNGKTCNGGSPGQQKKVKYCRDDYLKRQREREARLKKSRLLNTAPAHQVLEFLFPETKESVTTQRTSNHKTRNQALVTKLKELYNYTCQVEGCNETEVSLAHIYKHSLPDSVDNETNALCLCNNHHSAYDGDRLVLHPALDGRFIRYNRFGKVVEIGRIIYDEKHTIDVKWIKKSREYHDSKK